MPTEKELFVSQSMSVDKNGKYSLDRVYHIEEHDPDAAMEYGPAIGEQFKDMNIYCTSKNTEPISKDLCKLTCHYESPDQRTVATSKNKAVWNYDVSGESEHILSVDDVDKQIHYSIVSGSPTEGSILVTDEVGTAIGKQPDGTIDGVDIMLPRVTMTCETNKNPYEVDEGYKQMVYGLVGKVNSAEFKGWSAGEVLFSGCQITEVSGEMTRLSFKFLCSKNKDDISIDMLDTQTGDIYTYPNIPKDGWQYLWKRITKAGRDTKPDATTEPTSRAGTLSAHVATVYEQADFSVLGIAGLPPLFTPRIF